MVITLLFTLTYAIDVNFGSLEHRYYWSSASDGSAGVLSSQTGDIAPISVSQINAGEFVRIDQPFGFTHFNNGTVYTSCVQSWSESLSGTYLNVPSNTFLISNSLIRVSSTSTITPSISGSGALRVICSNIMPPNTSRPIQNDIHTYITSAFDTTIAQALDGMAPAVATAPFGVSYAHLHVKTSGLTSSTHRSSAFTMVVSPLGSLSIGQQLAVSIPGLTTTSASSCVGVAGFGDYREAFAWSNNNDLVNVPNVQSIAFSSGIPSVSPSVEILTVMNTFSIPPDVNTNGGVKLAAIVPITIPSTGMGSIFPAPQTNSFILITCRDMIIPATFAPSANVGSVQLVHTDNTILASQALTLSLDNTGETIDGGLQLPFTSVSLSIDTNAHSDEYTNIYIHFTPPNTPVSPAVGIVTSLLGITTTSTSTTSGGITETDTITNRSYLSTTRTLHLNISLANGVWFSRESVCRLVSIGSTAVNISVPIKTVEVRYISEEHLVSQIIFDLHSSIGANQRHSQQCTKVILPRTLNVDTTLLPQESDDLTNFQTILTAWNTPSQSLSMVTLWSTQTSIQTVDIETVRMSTAVGQIANYTRSLVLSEHRSIGQELYKANILFPLVGAPSTILGQPHRDVYIVGKDALYTENTILAVASADMQLNNHTAYVFTIPIDFTLPVNLTCSIFSDANVPMMLTILSHGYTSLLPTLHPSTVVRRTSPTAHVLTVAPVNTTVIPTHTIFVLCSNILGPSDRHNQIFKRDMFTGIISTPQPTSSLALTPQPMVGSYYLNHWAAPFTLDETSIVLAATNTTSLKYYIPASFVQMQVSFEALSPSTPSTMLIDLTSFQQFIPIDQARKRFLNSSDLIILPVPSGTSMRLMNYAATPQCNVAIGTVTYTVPIQMYTYTDTMPQKPVNNSASTLLDYNAYRTTMSAIPDKFSAARRFVTHIVQQIPVGVTVTELTSMKYTCMNLFTTPYTAVPAVTRQTAVLVGDATAPVTTVGQASLVAHKVLATDISLTSFFPALSDITAGKDQLTPQGASEVLKSKVTTEVSILEPSYVLANTTIQYKLAMTAHSDPLSMIELPLPIGALIRAPCTLAIHTTFYNFHVTPTVVSYTAPISVLQRVNTSYIEFAQFPNDLKTRPYSPSEYTLTLSCPVTLDIYVQPTSTRQYRTLAPLFNNDEDTFATTGAYWNAFYQQVPTTQNQRYTTHGVFLDTAVTLPAIPLAQLSDSAIYVPSPNGLQQTTITTLTVTGVKVDMKTTDKLVLTLPVPHTYSINNSTTCVLHANLNGSTVNTTIAANVTMMSTLVSSGSGAYSTLQFAANITQNILTNTTTVIRQVCRNMITPTAPTAAIQADGTALLGSLELHRLILNNTLFTPVAQTPPLFNAITAPQFEIATLNQSLPIMPDSPLHASYHNSMPYLDRFHIRIPVAFPPTLFSIIRSTTSVNADLQFNQQLPTLLGFIESAPGFTLPTFPLPVVFADHSSDVIAEPPYTILIDTGTRCYIDGVRAQVSYTTSASFITEHPLRIHTLHVRFPSSIVANTQQGTNSQHILLCTRLRYRGLVSAPNTSIFNLANSLDTVLTLVASHPVVQPIPIVLRQSLLQITAIPVVFPVSSILLTQNTVYTTATNKVGITAPRSLTNFTLALNTVPMSLLPNATITIPFPQKQDFFFDLPAPEQLLYTPMTSTPTTCTATNAGSDTTIIATVLYRIHTIAGVTTPQYTPTLFIRFASGLVTNTVTNINDNFSPVTVTCLQVLNPSTTAPSNTSAPLSSYYEHIYTPIKTSSVSVYNHINAFVGASTTFSPTFLQPVPAYTADTDVSIIKYNPIFYPVSTATDTTSTTLYPSVQPPTPTFLYQRCTHDNPEYNRAGTLSITLSPLLDLVKATDRIFFSLPSAWSTVSVQANTTACSVYYNETSTNIRYDIAASVDILQSTPTFTSNVDISFNTSNNFIITLTAVPDLPTTTILTNLNFHMQCLDVTTPLTPSTTSIDIEHMYIHHFRNQHTAILTTNPLTGVNAFNPTFPIQRILYQYARVPLPYQIREVETEPVVKVSILVGVKQLQWREVNDIISIVRARSGLTLPFQAYQIWCGDTCVITMGIKPTTAIPSSTVMTGISNSLPASTLEIITTTGWQAASNAPVPDLVNKKCFNNVLDLFVEVVGQGNRDIAGITAEKEIDCGGDECQTCPGDPNTLVENSNISTLPTPLQLPSLEQQNTQNQQMQANNASIPTYVLLATILLWNVFFMLM